MFLDAEKIASKPVKLVKMLVAVKAVKLLFNVSSLNKKVVE